MRWRVLISAPYFLRVVEEFRPRFNAAGVEIITANVDERLNEEDLINLVGSIDGAICGDDPFTEKVLLQAPRLKVISKWGTGIDSIDGAAAARLGIKVCNTPGAFTDPVADTTIGYILSFARQLPWMDQSIRDGRWAKLDSIALSRCCLGVVGVGNIGKAVVRRAKAFGMKLLGNDVKPVDGSFVAETGLEMTNLASLLAKSDFVSLHCDLNSVSFHLMGRAEFALMKTSAVLINTARGPVVDETALIEALRNQQIAGAALDVFELEPLPANSPLRAMGNCLFAPHNANSDAAARKRVHETTFKNLLAGLQGSSDDQSFRS